MSHFYGSITESARRTIPTARGHKSSGLVVEAASWKGKIVTRVWHNDEHDCDMFEVTQSTLHGAGVYEILASGVIGKNVEVK